MNKITGTYIKHSKSNELRTALIRNDWHLAYQIKPFQSIRHILTLIEEVKAKEIILCSQEEAHPLIQIIHINFSQLKHLDLAYNFIQSLHNLQLFKAPQLVELRLQSNNLTSLRSFRKSNFPHLTVLRLQNNYIRQIDISQANLPELSQLIFTANCGCMLLLKINSHQLKYMQIFGTKFPKQLFKLLLSRNNELTLDSNFQQYKYNKDSQLDSDMDTI